jgi:hypothetical protein
MQLRSGRAVTKSRTTREARLLDALGLIPLLESLDTFSLISLSSCSKYLSSSVTSFLQHSLQTPLIPAVLAVAASEQTGNEELLEYDEYGRLQTQDGSHHRAVMLRCKRAVHWLCNRAGSDAVALIPASALLALPNTSMLLAHSLIKAGLRVSYADVLAAAKQGVCGVDAWLAAAQRSDTEAGRSSGMPQLAVTLSYLVSMSAICIPATAVCVCALSPFHCWA